MGYDAVFISKRTAYCFSRHSLALWAGGNCSEGCSGLWKHHNSFLQYPLPHASWKVDGGGHERWQGTAEGARIITGLEAMGCCPTELADVPGTATQLQCDTGQVTLCQISRGWSWHGHPLHSERLTYPPVPDCSLRPRRVIFVMNWFPILFAAQAHKQLCVCVCVCCGGLIRCRARVGRHGLRWQGGKLLKLALQPEPLNGWTTADLQEGLNTCNCIWALCFEYKVLQRAGNCEHLRPCHPVSGTQNLLILHFYQAASHLQNT